MNFVEDKEWKNSLLMVSKMVSVRSGLLDLWCIPCIRGEKKKIKESKRVARSGGVEKCIGKRVNKSVTCLDI